MTFKDLQKLIQSQSGIEQNQLLQRLGNNTGGFGTHTSCLPDFPGHILSLRTGVSFDQLVKDRILNVLAMDSTGIRMNASGT